MEQNTVTINYQSLPDKAVVDKTSSALLLRGITTHYVQNKDEALQLLKELIPSGSEVMTGGSTTLDQIGFTDYLKSNEHPWKNKKAEILQEKNKEAQSRLRKQSVLTPYFIVSAHAITEQGQILNASATGSQIPSIAYTSQHVIFVVSANKIVPSLEDAIKRIHEYSFPLEDQRMKKLGQAGSSISRILIFERETDPHRKIELIFVNEVLGF